MRNFLKEFFKMTVDTLESSVRTMIMLRVTKAKSERKSGQQKHVRRIRFPGIMQDAAALKVHRIHLYRVLTGDRVSKSLTTRYQALKRGGAR